MANIIDNLNILDSKLDAARTKLAANLTAKGVPSDNFDTLDIMAGKVSEIPTGGGDINARWKEIGYVGEPSTISDSLEFAKQIAEADAKGEDISPFITNGRCTILPALKNPITPGYNTSSNLAPITYANDIEINGANVYSLFAYGKLVEIGTIISDTDNASQFFIGTPLKKIKGILMPNVTNFDSMFENCKYIEELPSIDISKAKSMKKTFYACKMLKKIHLLGNCTVPSYNMTDCFGSQYSHLADNGVLYYDHKYPDYYYSIISELKRWNPTWEAKLDYEPKECTKLVISTPETIDGYQTTVRISYTATTNGNDTITGERMENVELKGNATSEDFGTNTSYTDARQITVSYTYMGQTATATVTQEPILKPEMTVDLQNQWKQSTVSNPDSAVYDGVYESFSNKGQYDTNAFLKINFQGMKEIDVYLRNGGSYASEIFVGRQDQPEPTKDDNSFKITTYNQQGTDINSYTKHTIISDGGKHSVIIGYYKGYGSHTEPDCAYLLIKKPQA